MIIKQIAPATYLLPKQGNMLVDGLVIATPKLLEKIQKDRSLEQVCNVAHLPGIVRHSIAMPDAHWGYGFPIGGVAAMDLDHGVISPGGVGYDINCGVRLAVLNIPFSSFSKKAKEALLQALFHSIPSGMGHGHGKESEIQREDWKKIGEMGVRWAIDRGFGPLEDLPHIESQGCIPEADYSLISDLAKERGKSQMGTIGSGNHFVEIGEVSYLFEKHWNLEKGQTYVLIHSGSRGFGHQICQDTLDQFIKKGFDQNLPDRQLVAAPFKSKEGQEYFAKMAMAANYAFNNRQVILHYVRAAFQKVFGISHQEVRLIADICHNIARIEEHEGRKLLVHRKGATRAFKDQPVIVPGDMGRASYLLIGEGNPLTFQSSCHGAGRAKSRKQCLCEWGEKDTIGHMEKQGVNVMATSSRTIAEEMPDAYKDVDEVVLAVEEAKLARKVLKLKPYLVVKG